MLFWPVVSRSPTGEFATVQGLLELKPPKGEHRRPTFYSGRFCERVCRRTKSFRRTCNLKGNFACGSYGGFLAGSWQILGTFSAESRQDLGKISPKFRFRWRRKALEARKTPRKPRGSQRMTKSTNREPKGGQREPKWRPKGAKRSQKGGQREPRGRQNRPKDDQKSKQFFGSYKRERQPLFLAPFWLHFGSQNRRLFVFIFGLNF